MLLDIIVIALVALSVYLGYRKGLIKLIIKLLSFIISIVVAFFIFNPVANFVIDMTYIDETLENNIYQKSIEIIQNDNGEGNEYITSLKQQMTQGTLQSASRALAVKIVRIGVFLALFIILRIIMIFVSKLLNSVAKWPVLKQFNKIGGIAYGLLRGLIILYVALIVIQGWTRVDPRNVAYEEISRSYVTKMLYDNNVIDLLIANN